MLGITDYFWRLIPANPILLRVVEAGGKRKRDLFIRCGYLGLLIAVSLIGGIGGAGSGKLDELAQTSGAIFQRMSYLQLALVALLAPIFTAGAITQEKDSQTYDILLSTPLTNGQIVLGSLLSRLFFVIALLLSGIPIFSITQIFGGVSIASIVVSFAIAAATAFVTGALAMAIAVFKVGTRRTIFSFYLFIVIYLVGLFLLDQLPFFQITGRSRNPNETAHISWFTGLHPFLALQVIFNDPHYAPPTIADLPQHLRYWPVRWYLTNPAGFYITFMFFLSFVLIMPSIVLLRRLAQSTNSLRSWALQKLKLSKGDRTRKPRNVWSNPIAWREAKTKASAARASIMRYGFMAAGLVGAFILVVMYSRVQEPAEYVTASSYKAQHRVLTIYSSDGRSPTTYTVDNNTDVRLLTDKPAPSPSRNRYNSSYYNNNYNPYPPPATLQTSAGDPIAFENISGKLEVTSKIPRGGINKSLGAITLKSPTRLMPAKDVRLYLLGATIIEFAVILLIVTNAAASTVTREKEDGTLDILLATPITSRYYIWGKLRGLVSFVLPLVAVPVLSVALFIGYDILRLLGGAGDDFQWIVFPEALLILPATLIIVAAFAAILGMQMSLRCRTTVMAVMSSVGIVVGLCGLLGWCGYSVLENADSTPVLVIAAFSPFTVLTVLIDPYRFAQEVYFSSGESGEARSILFICAWIAAGGYTLTVWWMYRAMVKNFDMTIRKQSR